MSGYDVVVRKSARRHDQATEEVPWKTRLPAEFIFLVSRTNGRPVQPAFDFLRRKYIKGRKRLRVAGAANSVEATVRDLCDFHDFLDSRRVLVEHVDEALLEDYLESMIATPAPSTGKPYAAETIQRRRSNICSFLKDCQDQGRLKHRFSITAIKTPKGMLGVIAGDISTPPVGPIDRHIRALDPRVLKAMLDKTGPASVDISSDGHVVQSGHLFRKRLMPEVCVQTGLRREECCELKRDAIMKADIADRSPLSSVAIPVVGKGNKQRNVPFPVWLLVSLQNYIRLVRDPIVAEALAKGWMQADHGRAFVLETERADAFGRMILPGQFNREFRDAREHLVEQLAQDPRAELLAERVRRSRLTIHALRHTFALTTFIKRRSEGDADAAKYVQAVLGHTYRDTTERMYLRSSHIYEAELSEAYELLLREGIEQMRAS